MQEILDNSYFRTTKKNKYSFPKSQRFPQISKNSYTIDYFESKSLQKTRSTSFGFGSKYDFFKDVKKGPSPFEYSVEISDDSKQMSRGQSFGNSREVTKIHNYIDPQKVKTPKVGHYNADSLVLKNKSPSCSMIAKHPNDSFVLPNFNPDPLQYSPSDLFHSRRKRSAQFGFGSTPRFSADKKTLLGPGSYALSPNDKSKLGRIGVAERKTYAKEAIQRSISPGPKYFVR